MDKLIEYIPEKTIYYQLLNNAQLILIGIGFTIGAILICTIINSFEEIVDFIVIRSKKRNYKSLFKNIGIIFICTGLCYLSLNGLFQTSKKITDYQNQKYETKTIPLTNIKDNIIVENNKVIIKPLEQNYKYKDDKFDKTKEQTFKIEYDEFYNKYFLTDQYFTRHEISKEEYEMLKNK